MAEMPLNRICLHCGAEGASRLGHCSECGEVVCDKCGDTHLSMGRILAIHHACLKHAGSSTFSMIKFVD